MIKIETSDGHLFIDPKSVDAIVPTSHDTASIMLSGGQTFEVSTSSDDIAARMAAAQQRPSNGTTGYDTPRSQRQ